MAKEHERLSGQVAGYHRLVLGNTCGQVQAQTASSVSAKGSSTPRIVCWTLPSVCSGATAWAQGMGRVCGVLSGYLPRTLGMLVSRRPETGGFAREARPGTPCGFGMLGVSSPAGQLCPSRPGLDAFGYMSAIAACGRPAVIRAYMGLEQDTRTGDTTSCKGRTSVTVMRSSAGGRPGKTESHRTRLAGVIPVSLAPSGREREADDESHRCRSRTVGFAVV